MSAFYEAAVALFADTNFGLAATYTPVSGSPQAVTVTLLRQPVVIGEFGQTLETRDAIAFRLAEASPARGDHVLIGENMYRLDNMVEDGDDGIVRKLFALRIILQAANLITADGDQLITADSDYLMAA